MNLTDLILKTRINIGLMRDPRIGSFDIGVNTENGIVTLTGDVDDQEECRFAIEAAESIQGVKEVVSEMTYGVGKTAEDAEIITSSLLSKLEEVWDELPDRSALAEADYIRWATWLIYKFHLPKETEDKAQLESNAVEQAITRVATLSGSPKPLIALELLRYAESANPMEFGGAPKLPNVPMTATPQIDKEIE